MMGHFLRVTAHRLIAQMLLLIVELWMSLLERKVIQSRVLSEQVNPAIHARLTGSFPQDQARQIGIEPQNRPMTSQRQKNYCGMTKLPPIHSVTAAVDLL